MCLKMLSRAILFSLFQGVLSGATCSYSSPTVFNLHLEVEYHCSGYCCGSNTVRKCCTFANSNILYIGIGIGALVGLCIFIVMCVYCVHGCNTTSRRGTVVMPAQNPAFVVASGQQNCQQVGYSGCPPTYYQGPPAAYPPGQMPYPPAPPPTPAPAVAPEVYTGADPGLPPK